MKHRNLKPITLHLDSAYSKNSFRGYVHIKSGQRVLFSEGQISVAPAEAKGSSFPQICSVTETM